MKKASFALFFILTTAALIWNWSCSNNPAGAGNFQAPVITVVSINTPFTATPIPTDTPIPTSTATSTPTSTATPYVVSTWAGFNAPSAIAVDKNGKVYVADTGNNFVERYNSNGTLDITWGAGGLKGKVAYNSPKGIAVDANLNLFVVGNGNQVSRYSPVTVGSNDMTLISNSFSTVPLSGPLGVAANAAQTLVAVADTGNNRVVLLDYAGNSVSIFSSLSSAVYGIALDSNGKIFTSTGPSNTVVEVTSSPVTTIIGFNNPQGLAIDNSTYNNLWVADKGAKNVEQFQGSAIGSPPLVVFNANGTLNAPAGVAVDPKNGTVYVVDAANNSVVVFAP